MRRVIILKGEPPQTEEFKAGGAITPGDLLEFSNGSLVRHTAAGGNAAPIFALERDELGKDIDQDYAQGDIVKYATFRPGDEVNALVAINTVIAHGDFVESNGDGTVRKHTPPADLSAAAPAYRAIIGKALEAVDNTSGTGKLRCRVLVI